MLDNTVFRSIEPDPSPFIPKSPVLLTRLSQPGRFDGGQWLEWDLVVINPGSAVQPHPASDPRADAVMQNDAEAGEKEREGVVKLLMRRNVG
jgi:hypothetical protein